MLYRNISRTEHYSHFRVFPTQFGETERVTVTDLLDEFIFSRDGYYRMLKQGMLDL